MRWIGILVVVLAFGHGAPLRGQSPVKPLTNLELQARIAALEADLSRLQSDYALLLTTCRSPSSAARDTAAAERLERAALGLQDAERSAENKLQQVELLRQRQELDDTSFIVTSVDMGVTETNDVFVRYGWKVTVKNSGARQTFDLTIQFLDARGLVVDTARDYGEVISAFDQRTITGDDLIAMPRALNVVSAKAIATRK
jgi:hypothetical protein